MEARLKSHISSAKRGDFYDFQKAIREYGIESFESSIIEREIPLISILEHKDNLLNIREIYWIEYFDTHNNGYNMTKGGGGMSGHIKTKETIDKMKNTINNKSVEEKKILSDKLSKEKLKYYSINNHHTKGKTY